MAAAESYPDDLKYHREHDWARVEGDEAVLGVTWFAADALGELVHYEAPQQGGRIAKDRTRPRMLPAAASADSSTYPVLPAIQPPAARPEVLRTSTVTPPVRAPAG